jgi:hypothetical protein
MMCGKNRGIEQLFGWPTNIRCLSLAHQRFAMASEKKCPHCGQWTPWARQPSDPCAHCGEPLDPRTVAEKAAGEQKAEDDRANSFFTVKPTDRLPMIAVRKMAFVAHAIYAAIVWFFLVLFASTPG